jgi:hypothetical protein
VAAVLAVVAATPGGARAQLPPPPRIQPELRADVIVGHRPAVQVGAGLQVPVGFYVRIGIDAAVGQRVGVATDLPAGSRTDGRLDVLARFLLDPFRQTAYGLSVGGGMSLRAEPGDRVRPVLLVAMDVEGRRSAKGLVPAVQVGLGGGLRLGVVVRRGVTGSR